MKRPVDAIAKIIQATEDGRLKWQYISENRMQSTYNGGNFRLGWDDRRVQYVFTIKHIPGDMCKPAINNLNISESMAPNVKELYFKAIPVADKQEEFFAEMFKLFDVAPPVKEKPSTLLKLKNWFRGLL